MTESNRGGDAVHATFDKEVAVADDVLPIQVESNGGTVHVRISVIGGGGAVRDQPGGGFDVAKVDEGGDDVPVPDDEGAVADAEVVIKGQEIHGGLREIARVSSHLVNQQKRTYIF